MVLSSTSVSGRYQVYKQLGPAFIGTLDYNIHRDVSADLSLRWLVKVERQVNFRDKSELR